MTLLPGVPLIVAWSVYTIGSPSHWDKQSSLATHCTWKEYSLIGPIIVLLTREHKIHAFETYLSFQQKVQTLEASLLQYSDGSW